ncbi:MAG: 60S ribosomal protein L31 [Candidatus Methanomethylicia archaeon]|nr:60S ribosomal protein L31 [Candidatus Methanomethylicia archaeon]
MSADKTPSEAKPELDAAKSGDQAEITDESVKAEIEPGEESKKAEPEEAEAAEAPKKAEKGKKKKKREREAEEEKDEEKVLEEKSLTVNLRHAYLTYGRKAAPKAVRFVKEKARRVFKTEDVKLDKSVNEILWSRGKTKTERKIVVKVQKLEGGEVRVLAAEG